MEELVHVRFDDKLDPEKSKLVDKFEELEIKYTGPEDKESEAKEP